MRPVHGGDTLDAAADAVAYRAAKEPMTGYESRNWPRVCPLLFGMNDHDEPRFLYIKANDDDLAEDEPHAFVRFVVDVAEECCIDVRAAHRCARLPLHVPLISRRAVPSLLTPSSRR